MRILSLVLLVGTVAYFPVITGKLFTAADNSSSPQYERIMRFECDIIVQTDGQLRVCETLTVFSTGTHIIHGIAVDLPTRYKNKWGFAYNTNLTILDVRHNGNPVKSRIEDTHEGEKLYIGDPQIYLEPGKHVYAVTYTISHHIGFFKEHDELFWNVMGFKSQFVVEYASAHITLPPEVPVETVGAYTGYYGQRGEDFRAQILPNGHIFVETTKPMQPQQGLTVVVTWPKGFIAEPSFLARVWYFVCDNIALAIFVFGILLIILFYCFVYWYVRKNIVKGAVIPLFYPPNEMTPGSLRYCTRMDYDAKVAAADIVAMAVHGLITISYQKNAWGKGKYLLLKRQDTDEKTPVLYQKLYHMLFHDRDQVTLSSSHGSIIEHIASTISSYYYHDIGSEYFSFNTRYAVIAVLFSMAVAGLTFSLSIVWQPEWWLMLIAICVIIHLIGLKFLRSYNQKGQKLKEQIEGFEMFLSATQTEWLKTVGTPPTKTPQLYEKYLPYAIALGVEEQWSKQFAPIFQQLRHAGHTYAPVWYTGPFDTTFLFTRQFTADLSKGLSYAPSAPAPGTYSGAGGRGSAGGGGGGTSVGGW
jgi:hypothetical protein